MKELIEVDVIKLTPKHIERIKVSAKPNEYVTPERNYAGETFELLYTFVNGQLKQFVPEKQCIVTVGHAQVLMSLKNFNKLKAKEKAIDKPKKNK